MLNSSVFSAKCLTSLQLSESEFHVIEALKEKAFDDKVSDIWSTVIICDKNGEYEFYFPSCMNIIFNELRQQWVKYDVYTTSKIKHTRHFYHILFFTA